MSVAKEQGDEADVDSAEVVVVSSNPIKATDLGAAEDDTLIGEETTVGNAPLKGTAWLVPRRRASRQHQWRR